MSDLTPELAAKVLAANLRNIVKKIGDGGTLTTAEAEIMEMAKTNGQLTEELKLARRAALIRKFAAGHRLNGDELAQISEIIPATAIVVRKVTAQNYRLTLREYSEQFIQFGMESKKDNERKLKNWIWHGRFDKNKEPRDPPDFPPFDAPDQLAAWWRRCMTYKPPDWMITLEKSVVMDGAPQQAEKPATAAAGSSEPTQPTPQQAQQQAPQPVSDQVTYGDLEVDGEIANDLTVKILAGAAKDSLRRYNEAREAKDSRQARMIRDELLDDVKALQRARVEALKLLAAEGDYLRRKETLQSLNALLAMQDTSFYNALEEAIRVANPKIEPEKRRDMALSYRDKVFEHWERTEFAEAWAPQEHAA